MTYLTVQRTDYGEKRVEGQEVETTNKLCFEASLSNANLQHYMSRL